MNQTDETLEETTEERHSSTELALREGIHISKQTLANQKIEQAQKDAQDAEDEIKVCIDNITQDVDDFEKYKTGSLYPVLEQSRTLFTSIALKKIQFKEPKTTDLDLKDPEEEKIIIKPLSSGRFTASMQALLGGGITLAGWYAFATTKASLPIVPQTLPSIETLKQLLTSASDALGLHARPEIGLSVILGSTLIVMLGIYFTSVIVRSNKNLLQAEEIEEEVGFYCTKKEECKEKMAKIREHLKELDTVVRTYKLYLAEKNAGLERAIFVEKAENIDKLHPLTQASAHEMQQLITELDRLLATPMAHSGMLTKDSMDALKSSETTINNAIGKLYQ